MIALFTNPIEYDADELRKAMKGIGTNENTLIEIIASRPPGILRQIIAKLNEKYKRDLEKDVKSETSGSLRKLLIGESSKTWLSAAPTQIGPEEIKVPT